MRWFNIKKNVNALIKLTVFTFFLIADITLCTLLLSTSDCFQHTGPDVSVNEACGALNF